MGLRFQTALPADAACFAGLFGAGRVGGLRFEGFEAGKQGGEGLALFVLRFDDFGEEFGGLLVVSAQGVDLGGVVLLRLRVGFLGLSGRRGGGGLSFVFAEVFVEEFGKDAFGAFFVDGDGLVFFFGLGFGFRSR